MIKDITIGQYYSAKSIIHRLDARIKIILTIAFIVDIFLIKNFWGLGAIVVTLIAGILLSKVPLKMVLKSIMSARSPLNTTVEKDKQNFEFKLQLVRGVWKESLK